MYLAGYVPPGRCRHQLLRALIWDFHSCIRQSNLPHCHKRGEVSPCFCLPAFPPFSRDPAIHCWCWQSPLPKFDIILPPLALSHVMCSRLPRILSHTSSSCADLQLPDHLPCLFHHLVCRRFLPSDRHYTHQVVFTCSRPCVFHPFPRAPSHIRREARKGKRRKGGGESANSVG